MKHTFLADFSYVSNALKQHPMLMENDKEEFNILYQKLQTAIYDYDSLIDALTELTMFFHDGHTNIELPYTSEDKCLKIICKWENERLVLREKYQDIPAGAEVYSVESKTVPELFSWAEARIPHENRYLVRSRMIEYPYQNYHVFSEMNLKKIFGKKEAYSVTFLVNGEKLERTCLTVNYDGFLDFSQETFVSYEIKENTLVLHLRECIYNEEYKSTLQKAAELCEEKMLDALELDLSGNMGGNSQVIDEFINYTHADTFHRYEMIDYSSDRPVCISNRNHAEANNKQDVLFPKKIICRVSNTTFSSARTFAVTLKDNGIATIVGEPTGGKPCSYGMPKRDVTPNHKIRFRVSRALFLRPDAELDGEEALFPEKKES